MIIDEAFFGMARTGTIDGKVRYPNILTTSNDGELKKTEKGLLISENNMIEIPETYSFISDKNDENYPSSSDIVLVPQGAALIQRPRKLLETIGRIRKKFGLSKIIYLQGISDPYLFPVLVYAGVSLLDDSTLRMQSLRGVKYTELGRIAVSGSVHPSNLLFAKSIMELISSSIRNGTLREVVEKYQFSAKAIELLRILDSSYEKEMEEVFPRRTPYIMANSLESLRRPDLVRYRKYISTEYRKPADIQVALFLPCSARKPYSTSKSHRKIIDAISDMRRWIHEVIVTSPVGLVPRDLEEAYPARFYNIPVIGEWYDEEKRMIRETVSGYMMNNRYHAIFTFVSDDLDFIHDVLPEDTLKVPWTGDMGRSLANLREELSKYFRSEGDMKGKKQNRLEYFSQLASYQFGSWIGQYVSECKVVKNYNSIMLVRDGKPFLVYNPALGKFTINKQSAPLFADENRFVVEIDDFKPTANVYAVGVESATSDIRQEDEVVLCHRGDVRGVGIAKMPAEAMIELDRGVAVKVRN